MTDFDPLTIPAVMPKSVRRTDERGLPTDFLLNDEQAVRAWMKANVANTNTRINSVSDGVDGVAAAVATEAMARADADAALATQVSAVEASVGDISANGAVYLAAKAAPGGATAAYGWFIAAGDAFAGMEAIALSGGGSALAFTADKFRFVDSGSATPVWTYSGGKFQFTADVAINGALTVNGTIATDKVASNAITQLATNTSTGNATVSMTLRASARVLVIASWTGNPGGINIYPATATGLVNIYVNGGLFFQKPCGFFQDIPANPSFTYRAPLPTTYQAEYTAGAAGVYTFDSQNVWNGITNGTGENTISVLELAR
jgi:hypothetical protein